MMDAIVIEGINPSQRINGLIFTRQVGNTYLHGHGSMTLLETYREQFWDVPKGMDLFESYFEQHEVPEPNSAEAGCVSLCFGNFYRQFSAQQMSSMDSLLARDDFPSLAHLFRAANPNDGIALLVLA